MVSLFLDVTNEIKKNFLDVNLKFIFCRKKHAFHFFLSHNHTCFNIHGQYFEYPFSSMTILNF